MAEDEIELLESAAHSASAKAETKEPLSKR